MRIGATLTFLIASKLLNVQIPIIFKHIVDALSVAPDPVLAIPVSLLLGYGLARAGASGFQELRNAIFARVSATAIRKVARKTFLHLHHLDLSFHLGRETGGLARAIDRGTRGISFIFSSMLFNVVPTIFEIGLVSGIMWYSFGPAYAAVTLSTLAAYTVFTLMVTKWRTQIRRRMNALDNEAGTLTVDSLMNYETVKVLGAVFVAFYHFWVVVFYE